jgi:putative transposase
MIRPYSNDLRERVVGAVERGEMSPRQAASHYGVGISTAIKWVLRLRRTGSVSPSKIGGYRPKKLIGSWRLWLSNAAGAVTSPCVAWTPNWPSEA